jgi:hypothetical protein
MSHTQRTRECGGEWDDWVKPTCGYVIDCVMRVMRVASESSLLLLLMWTFSCICVWRCGVPVVDSNAQVNVFSSNNSLVLDRLRNSRGVLDELCSHQQQCVVVSVCRLVVTGDFGAGAVMANEMTGNCHIALTHSYLSLISCSVVTQSQMEVTGHVEQVGAVTCTLTCKSAVQLRMMLRSPNNLHSAENWVVYDCALRCTHESVDVGCNWCHTMWWWGVHCDMVTPRLHCDSVWTEISWYRTAVWWRWCILLTSTPFPSSFSLWLQDNCATFVNISACIQATCHCVETAAVLTVASTDHSLGVHIRGYWCAIVCIVGNYNY